MIKSFLLKIVFTRNYMKMVQNKEIELITNSHQQ
nr:MAG TPA: hypothetical protein [Caudoviricetes sp.]